MRAYFEDATSRSGSASSVALYNLGVSVVSVAIVALIEC